MEQRESRTVTECTVDAPRVMFRFIKGALHTYYVTLL